MKRYNKFKLVIIKIKLSLLFKNKIKFNKKKNSVICRSIEIINFFKLYLKLINIAITIIAIYLITSLSIAGDNISSNNPAVIDKLIIVRLWR